MNDASIECNYIKQHGIEAYIVDYPSESHFESVSVIPQILNALNSATMCVYKTQFDKYNIGYTMYISL